MNKTLWMGVGILVAVVLVSGYLLYGKGAAYKAPPNQGTSTPAPTATATPNPSGAVKEFTIQAKEFSFAPSTITVNKGDNVVITLKNVGTVSHNLTIGDLNLATNTIAPGQTAAVSFTADKDGMFAFYCSVDGHRDLGMEGTLEVK